MLRNAKIHLERFAQRIVKSAKGNLSRRGKNVTSSLKESIGFELKEDNKDIVLSFFMNEYGAFQDQGVKGANPSLVKNGKQKAPNSPFRFKTKMPPQKPLERWAKARNIRLRDEKGRFQKGSYKTMGFILQKRIFAQGMKPSLFFTKPFENAFENLPEPLLEALGDDLLNDIFKKDG